MIDWPTIKPLLTELIRDISEVSVNGVKWAKQSEGSAWQDTPTILLSISPITRQGTDEVLLSDKAARDQVVTVGGQRKFVLHVRCETFEQDIASPNYAGNIIDRVAVRMKRPSSLERIRGICAIEYLQPTTDHSFTQDDRAVSAFTMDVLMRTVDNDIDVSYGAGGWIGEALVNSNPLYDVDGNPTASQVVVDAKP